MTVRRERAPRIIPGVITRWPNTYERQGREVRIEWRSFLRGYREPAPFKGHREHPGWSPAVFAPCSRHAPNVVAVTALIATVEGTIGDSRRALGRWFGVAFTSLPQAGGPPLIHVVLPFSRPVLRDELQRTCAWAERRGRGKGVAVSAERDGARMLYMPASVPGTEHRAVRFSGPLLDVDEVNRSI